MENDIEKFLQKVPENNIEFATQLILSSKSVDKIDRFVNYTKLLNNILYKSYLKDLTINDLDEVATIILKFRK